MQSLPLTLTYLQPLFSDHPQIRPLGEPKQTLDYHTHPYPTLPDLVRDNLAPLQKAQFNQERKLQEQDRRIKNNEKSIKDQEALLNHLHGLITNMGTSLQEQLNLHRIEQQQQIQRHFSELRPFRPPCNPKVPSGPFISTTPPATNFPNKHKNEAELRPLIPPCNQIVPSDPFKLPPPVSAPNKRKNEAEPPMPAKKIKPSVGQSLFSPLDQDLVKTLRYYILNDFACPKAYQKNNSFFYPNLIFFKQNHHGPERKSLDIGHFNLMLPRGTAHPSSIQVWSINFLNRSNNLLGNINQYEISIYPECIKIEIPHCIFNKAEQIIEHFKCLNLKNDINTLRNNSIIIEVQLNHECYRIPLIGVATGFFKKESSLKFANDPIQVKTLYTLLCQLGINGEERQRGYFGTKNINELFQDKRPPPSNLEMDVDEFFNSF